MVHGFTVLILTTDEHRWETMRLANKVNALLFKLQSRLAAKTSDCRSLASDNSNAVLISLGFKVMH